MSGQEGKWQVRIPKDWTAEDKTMLLRLGAVFNTLNTAARVALKFKKDDPQNDTADLANVHLWTMGFVKEAVDAIEEHEKDIAPLRESNPDVQKAWDAVFSNRPSWLRKVLGEIRGKVSFHWAKEVFEQTGLKVPRDAVFVGGKGESDGWVYYTLSNALLLDHAFGYSKHDDRTEITRRIRKMTEHMGKVRFLIQMIISRKLVELGCVTESVP